MERPKSEEHLFGAGEDSKVLPLDHSVPPFSPGKISMLSSLLAMLLSPR